MKTEHVCAGATGIGERGETNSFCPGARQILDYTSSNASRTSESHPAESTNTIIMRHTAPPPPPHCRHTHGTARQCEPAQVHKRLEPAQVHERSDMVLGGCVNCSSSSLQTYFGGYINDPGRDADVKRMPYMAAVKLVGE